MASLLSIYIFCFIILKSVAGDLISDRIAFLHEWKDVVRTNLTTKGQNPNLNTHYEFHRMITTMNLLTKSKNIPLDLVLIGACDGTVDSVITMFFDNPHIRGVFVEPDERNFAMLEERFRTNNVSPDRALLVRAAVADTCKSGEITFYIPSKAEDPKEQHFIKHQLGTVLEDVAKKHAKWIKSPDVVAKIVPCVSIADVLSKAEVHFAERRQESFNPMLVKTDTEGNDANILTQYTKYLSTFGPPPNHISGMRGSCQPKRGSCYASFPLLLLWEKDKLSKEAQNELRSAFKEHGYLQHDEIVAGTWYGRDMYAVLMPTAPNYVQTCCH